MSLVTIEEDKVMLYLPFLLQQKPFGQLYITNKIKCFSFKSWHPVHVELAKKDQFQLNTTLYYFKKFITKLYPSLNQRIKFVCIAMYSFVMIEYLLTSIY